MNWNIVVDSSCDLKMIDCKDVNYSSVPFIISVGKKDYVDNDTIDVKELVDDMETSKEISHTSCPAPGEWLECFEREGNVIAITISKELSGSYNSAFAAREMILEKEPGRNIEIINSVSAGPGLIIVVQSILDAIKEGKSFDEVVSIANGVNIEKRTIFALSSYRNLIKAGRMSPIVGFVAQKLNFWGIGVASAIGEIEIMGKARGSKKALEAIAKDIHDRKENIKKVIISHCQNLEFAENLKNEIAEKLNNVVVEIYENRGLCSFYAERHGLIVAYV